jgi:hypothetical protein
MNRMSNLEASGIPEFHGGGTVFDEAGGLDAGGGIAGTFSTAGGGAEVAELAPA